MENTNGTPKKKRYRKFTEAEDEIIRKNFPTMQRAVCELLPDRSPGCVMQRAKVLGLEVKTVIPYSSWSPKEDEILTKHYPEMGMKVIELLPNRTHGAIKYRVKSLKLRMHTDWGYEEDHIIREHNCQCTDALIAALPHRTKSEIAARVQLLHNRYKREIQFPLNLYMAMFDTHEDYSKCYANFLFLVEKVYKGIEGNTINPDIGAKIVTAIKYRYEEYMEIDEIAHEMNITEAQAEDLVNRGLKVLKHYIKRGKSQQ